MNQISAHFQVEYEDGERTHSTIYTGSCGCVWRVDMYGNVRSVSVCRDCMVRPLPWEEQMALQLVTDSE